MIDLEQHTRDKKPYEHRKISNAHTFNYIVLRVNPGLTSCEDLAIALQSARILQWITTRRNDAIITEVELAGLCITTNIII